MFIKYRKKEKPPKKAASWDHKIEYAGERLYRLTYHRYYAKHSMSKFQIQKVDVLKTELEIKAYMKRSGINIELPMTL